MTKIIFFLLLDLFFLVFIFIVKKKKLKNIYIKKTYIKKSNDNLNFIFVT